MSPHRRAAGSYARRGPVREPYDRVLIVCEGKKTEPYYFRGLRLHYRLSSANIEIMPADGTDPLSIVSFAQTRLGDYDRAFCVLTAMATRITTVLSPRWLSVRRDRQGS